MTFELDGQRYRIGFEHDKPRDWESHADDSLDAKTGEPRHEVVLRPLNNVQQTGQTHLYCVICRVILAGVSPAIARKLSTASLVRRELARNVRCTIYRREGEEWVPLYSGSSRLNADAGDTYEREKGRMSALRDALPAKAPAPEGLLGELDARYRAEENWRIVFCSRAMIAYLERKKSISRSRGAE